MSDDSRKNFLLATAADFFGVSPEEPNMMMLLTTNELNNFLDDGNCNVLVARFTQQPEVSSPRADSMTTCDWSVRLANTTQHDDGSAVDKVRKLALFHLLQLATFACTPCVLRLSSLI